MYNVHVTCNIQKTISDSRTQIESYYETVIVSSAKGDMAQKRIKQGKEDEVKQLNYLITRLESYKETISNVVKEVTAQNEINKIFKDIGITVEEKLTPAVRGNAKSMGLMTTEIHKQSAAWKLNKKEIDDNATSAYQFVQNQQKAIMEATVSLASNATAIVNAITDPVKQSIDALFNNGQAVGKNFFKAVAQNFVSLAPNSIAYFRFL
jgi:hypothetical protein